jgi:hypothetical protein
MENTIEKLNLLSSVGILFSATKKLQKINLGLKKSSPSPDNNNNKNNNCDSEDEDDKTVKNMILSKKEIRDKKAFLHSLPLYIIKNRKYLYDTSNNNKIKHTPTSSAVSEDTLILNSSLKKQKFYEESNKSLKTTQFISYEYEKYCNKNDNTNIEYEYEEYKFYNDSKRRLNKSSDKCKSISLIFFLI